MAAHKDMEQWKLISACIVWSYDLYGLLNEVNWQCLPCSGAALGLSLGPKSYDSERLPVLHRSTNLYGIKIAWRSSENCKCFVSTMLQRQVLHTCFTCFMLQKFQESPKYTHNTHTCNSKFSTASHRFRAPLVLALLAPSSLESLIFGSRAFFTILVPTNRDTMVAVINILIFIKKGNQYSLKSISCL